jgi:hypothetical protein
MCADAKSLLQRGIPVQGVFVLEGPLEADMVQQPSSQHVIAQHHSFLGRGSLLIAQQPLHRIAPSEAALIPPKSPDPAQQNTLL